MIFSFTTPERRNNETQTGKNASGAHFEAPKPTFPKTRRAMARCHIKPDADVDAYLEAARVADAAVQASEPGMLHHTFDQDPDDPRMFVWSEVYADDESLLFHLTNPPLQKFVQQHSEEYGDGFSIEIYGTLDAETKEKFSATGFPIKYFDTRLGYSRCRK